jgi:hypothetical protein
LIDLFQPTGCALPDDDTKMGLREGRSRLLVVCFRM